MADELKIETSLGADGKTWFLPCAYTNRPLTGGSRFGWREHPYGGYKFHKGVDLSSNIPDESNTAVKLYATKSGVITVSTYDSDSGNYVILDHKDGTKSVYMHMGKAYGGEYPHKDINAEENNYNSFRLAVGTELKQGDLVGYMGSTGCSTGRHLHFGIQKSGHNDPDSGSYVDPMLYIGNVNGKAIIDSSNTIDVENRITLQEAHLGADWTPPIIDYTNDSKASIKMSLIRKHQLLSETSNIIFSNYTTNQNKLSNCSVLGLNETLNILTAVNKNDVINNGNNFWNIARDNCGYGNGSSITKNNFSYVISRVNDVINKQQSSANNFIIKKEVEDWFDYNRQTLKYPYGQVPKCGAIMCWKPKKDGLDYKVKFVESVLGTHWINVSEYDESKSTNNGGNPAICSLLKNTDHNWGEPSNYIFQGFIYPINDLNISQSGTAKTETSSISYENGELILKVYNDTTQDKYSTLLFDLGNMKHINRLSIRYELFNDNEKTADSENSLAICLTQQVWNTPSIGKLMVKNTSESDDFIKNWPKTYFPYKPLYKNGSLQIPEDSEYYKHPYRYNAPFPVGMLCLNNIKVSDIKNENNEIFEYYDLDNYSESGKTISSFEKDAANDIQYLLRNHPGYLCLVVKAPNRGTNKYTGTILKIKEIITYG